MEIRDFFIEGDITKKIKISDRFRDKENRELYFEIKPISASENFEILQTIKDKNGNYDNEKYKLKLISKSVLSPNLNDSELQSFYKALGSEMLISKMLFAGEYEILAKNVLEISGFSDNLEGLVNSLKN